MMYDVAIIGLGPAGATAAIYSARYNLKTIVVGQVPGGTAAEAHKICNYPPFAEIKGFELAQRLLQHVQAMNVEVVFGKVENIEKKKDFFELNTGDKKIQAKKIVIATGTKRKQLGISRENEFRGKGISYCATCDGMFYKNKVAGVVGGGNAALTAALLLSEFAEKVYIFYRKDKFYKAEPAWTEQVLKNKKISPIFDVEIKELIGKTELEAVKLSNKKEIKLDGLFVEIGSDPNIAAVESLGVKKDERGYIIIDENCKTNIKGVYAAGDITNHKLKQIVVAEADGAVAATNIYHELMQ
ncbi:MAG: FAD-dependent oxidoreductase [Candidatus ainarchaeum sp.]|nr:FAD-dependent oxidoreductase [Candidatus ainarchaeum sp.]